MGPSGVSSSLPTGSPRKGAYPGEHRGRPRRRDGKQPANPGERAGTEPRPYRSSSGPMQASALTEEWGIRRCFSPWNNRSPPLGAQRSVRARPGKSPGRGRKPLPGFRLRRKEAESFFPAACTAGKIPLTKRRVEEAPPQWGGASSAPKRSAMPPPAMPEGALAIVLPKGGTGQGDSKGGTSVPPFDFHFSPLERKRARLPSRASGAAQVADRAVHRKGYRSVPMIRSANWKLSYSHHINLAGIPFIP